MKVAMANTTRPTRHESWTKFIRVYKRLVFGGEWERGGMPGLGFAETKKGERKAESDGGRSNPNAQGSQKMQGEQQQHPPSAPLGISFKGNDHPANVPQDKGGSRGSAQEEKIEPKIVSGPRAECSREEASGTGCGIERSGAVGLEKDCSVANQGVPNAESEAGSFGFGNLNLFSVWIRCFCCNDFFYLSPVEYIRTKKLRVISLTKISKILFQFFCDVFENIEICG